MNERLEISKSYMLAEQLDRAADTLKWCLAERYHVRSGDLLRGHNEVVSLYCRPDEHQAKRLAVDLEAVIGPVRTTNALRLIAEIEGLLPEIKMAIEGGS